MIQEIVNYIKHLKENSPQVLEMGLKPTKGLHIFVELDENGNAINFPGQKGVNWDYFDGKNLNQFLTDIIQYEQKGQRIGTRMDKVLDVARIGNSKKFQIFSCSPFIISFKKHSLNLIKNRLDSFFEKAISVCIPDGKRPIKKIILSFKEAIKENCLDNINLLVDDNNNSIFENMKKDYFVFYYLKNIDFSEYESAYSLYLKNYLFNINNFNSENEINDETYGLSGFYNGLNSKKPFLEHKTASMYKGIPYRIKAKDAILLNDFELLIRHKTFPNPLPLFIDEKEFLNADEIISIFQEDTKLSYSQILKRIFRDNENRILQDYYLLFFCELKYGLKIEDFDFVSRFRYSLNENNGCPEIKNLFNLTKNKEQIPDREIRNIFQFESYIVRMIFNNSLVKIEELNNVIKEYKVKYFGDIKLKYVSGGEPIYLMLLKYRKAFYDYIYKSKTQAINSFMWDEIMWNSILADLRSDKMTNKGYHSNEFRIEEKLNIWFSLYNYFDKKNRRYNMASKIPDLIGRMREITNDENKHFDNTEEFAFGAGQLIRKLLDASESGERTHALLEPFLQKTNIEQLNLAIARTFEKYKHAFKFYRGDTRYAFDKIISEVMGFEISENLKKYLPMILAGYFAESVFKKDNSNSKILN